MKLIDYVFYRIYSFYKQKKDSAPIITSCIILSLTALMPLLCITYITGVLTKDTLKISKLIMLIVYIAVVAVFWRRYKSKELISRIEERYLSENTIKKKQRGILLLFYIVIIISLPILFGVFKHNLHYI